MRDGRHPADKVAFLRGRDAKKIPFSPLQAPNGKGGACGSPAQCWLDRGISYGALPYRLLKAVDESGSINRAARMTNMSFRTAWRILNTFEKAIGADLVEKKQGGVCGGGSKLTDAGRRFISRYEQFYREATEVFETLFQKHFCASAGDADET
jgi:molybdate transport system regulatory protein